MNYLSGDMIKLLMPLIIIQFALMIFCLFLLKKDKVRFLPKWVWAFIIILGELLGPIIYLILGREKE